MKPLDAVRVRRMTAADLDRVMEIAASLPEAPRWPRSAYMSALEAEAVPFRIVLVAENADSGAVVGFAVVGLVQLQAELEIIAVATDAQRSGVARRLFAKLTEEVYTAGAREIILEVRASNLPALRLYRGLGFAEAGRRPRYYRDPVDDAVLMRLGLADGL